MSPSRPGLPDGQTLLGVGHRVLCSTHVHQNCILLVQCRNNSVIYSQRVYDLQPNIQTFSFMIYYRAKEGKFHQAPATGIFINITEIRYSRKY